MSDFPLLRPIARLGSWLLSSIAVLSAHASVAAQPVPYAPHVVLVQPEGEPPRPGLEPSLRIQLRDDAELVSQTAAWPADLPSRIDAASRLAEDTGADWVVWAGAPVPAHEAMSASEGETENAVLYLVGRRDGRALIEVVRVPAGRGPEVDRSLALKVHELISAGDGAAFALGNAELPPPQQQKRIPTPGERGRAQLWLEAGAAIGGASSAGLTADMFIAIGPSFATRDFMLAVPLELALGLPRSVETSAGDVEWSELGIAVVARIAIPFGKALQLGAGAGGKLAFIDAEGTAPSGARGTSTQRLPVLLLSFDAELQIAPQLGARFSLGLEQRLRRQHLLIEGREIADTGRTLPFGRVSIVWHAF